MKKTDTKNKYLQFFLKTFLPMILSPFAIGIYLTLGFVFAAKIFYQVRNQNDAGLLKDNVTSFVYRGVEGLDYLLSDTRFLIRGEKKRLDAQVALVAFDDESLAVVSRWPWSRDLKAKMIENLFKYNVKSVGLDIIWSEPQETTSLQTIERLETQTSDLGDGIKEILKTEKARPQPDDVLAETLKRHSDRIVLGVFPTDETDHIFKPYSDYCRNEAFNAINGSIFVKPDNFTLAVIDNADKFEAVNFKSKFDKIFPIIIEQTTNSFIKHLGKSKSEELTKYEKNRMQISVESEIMNYCDKWLVVKPNDPAGSDPFIAFWTDFFSELSKSDEALKTQIVSSKFDIFNGLNPDSAIEKFKSLALSHPVPQHNSWTINLPMFHAATPYSGSFKAFQDDDGKIRRNPLFYRTGNRIGNSFIPSLALQTYLAANPGYQAQVEIDVDPRNSLQKSISSFKIIDINKEGTDQDVMKIPVDGQGRMKINYAGPQQTYAHIPVKELVNDSNEMNIYQRGRGTDEYHREKVNKADFLKDKIILIGATAVGIYDLRVTPFEKNFPGPETHLTVLDNLVQRDFLRVNNNEDRAMMLALTILGLLLSAGVAFTGPLIGFIFVILIETLLIYLDQRMMQWGLVSTMILPALEVATLYVVLILYKYFTEEQKKKQLKVTFSKYVSPAIVDEILKSPENIELGGRKQRLSVFFSDLRGFTTISEKLDPQKLSSLLNRYLTPMTQIVFKNKGTLDKYMGDAIMAFFGAPIGFPDHAEHACRCALSSIVKLKQLQAEFAAENLPYIDLGIGINTAEVSVGNMGSDIVQSYTVMGDGVNLASRLEAINKEYGTRIILSEFTFKDVAQKFTCREVDLVRVKGKLEPVRIYELICEGAPSAAQGEALNAYSKGLAQFRARDFHSAIESFKKYQTFEPKDRLTDLYVERCHSYLADPPPENWDGVVVMKTK